MDPKELQRQLVVTFRAELAEHLSTLNKGLLALEEGTAGEEREELLAGLFRAAHSLKGASRVVQLDDIESIAHLMEDVLGAVQDGTLDPTPEMNDVLFEGIDALQEAMDLHLEEGRLEESRRARLLARLEAVIHGGPAHEGAAEEGAASPGGLTDLPGGEAVQQGGPGHSPAAIGPAEETIRVSTAKLDDLMDGVGELLIARMRTDQRYDEFRGTEDRLLQWEKAWRQTRPIYRRLQRNLLAYGHGSDDNGGGDLAPLPSEISYKSADITAMLDLLHLTDMNLRALSNEIHVLVRQMSGDQSYLGHLTDSLQDGVRRVRMLPVATLFEPLARMVRDLGRERGKRVALRIEGDQTEVDRQVLESLKDPLVHLLRNALDHGIESPQRRQAAGKPPQGIIRLEAAARGNSIVLTVSDDGAGIDRQAVRQAAVERGILSEEAAASLSDEEALQLVFRSGLSTQQEVTDLSGRGVGLDVVRRNLEELHGLIEVTTRAGEGTSFVLTVPLTLATSQVLLVTVAGQTVALPTTNIQRILKIQADEVGSLDGRPSIRVAGQPLPLLSLTRLLELDPGAESLAADQSIPVIIAGAAEKRMALRVDQLLTTQEVVIKSLGWQLSRVRNVSGATILGDGQVVMILNVADLAQSAQGRTTAAAPLVIQAEKSQRRRVLVVDDSITTRTLEKNILESMGYRVLVAADGREGWALAQSERLDLVVSDVAMPHMDGFRLTERIKNDPRLAELPVVLVTSLASQKDRARGLDVGADAYIVKSDFDQTNLLETIERLIG